jgi:hypothetical protein
MLKILLTICLPLGLIDAGLFGQSLGAVPKNKWEFSFLVGAALGWDDSSATPVEGQDTPRLVRLSVPLGYTLGFVVTENLGQHVAAELSYSLADQPLTFRDLKPTLPSLKLDQHIHSVQYSLLVYPWSRKRSFRPFLSVGGGVLFYRIGGDSKAEALVEGIRLKDRWKLSLNVGGGFKYALSTKWGVRVDLADRISGVPDYGLPATAPFFQGNVGAGFRPEGRLHNRHLSGGITYYW